MAEEDKAAESNDATMDGLKGLGFVNWFVILVVSSLLLVISHYAIVFLLLGMSPAIVARIADKRIGNCASRTIGAFNFMGMLPFLFELVRHPDPCY